MIFPAGAATQTSAAEAAQGVWDAVIVGGGMAGSIVAEQLGQAGYRVLILEAAPARTWTSPSTSRTCRGSTALSSRTTSLRTRSTRMPACPGAPTPCRCIRRHPETTSTSCKRTSTARTPPSPGSSAAPPCIGRKALRMLPEDFDLRTTYKQGLNWPLSYNDLEPYYRKAEAELGVAAEVKDQTYLGMHFPEGYVFPMHRMPPSYLDQVVARGVDGMRVNLADDEYTLQVRSFPQARNGVPNAAYDGGKGFVPVGAVSTSQVEEGERCQGNTNCVPICPVQAKYHSGKTLAKALSKGNVKIVTQAVASKVEINEHNQRVAGITFKKYESLGSEKYTEYTVEGAVYILCAHAIENARLMLASDMQHMSRSKLIGRNLMDHAYLLTWGLLPEPAGTMRGTTCTGGITDLRGGRFRATQAGFGVDIHNDGWGWATGSPYTDLVELVDKRGLRGRELRRTLGNQISRQLLLAFMIDLLPDRNNTVTVDERYKDALGNLKPVVSFKIPAYTMRGAAFARKLATDIFEKLGAEDRTTYNKNSYSAVEHDGQWYNIVGGNHLAGTHIMGTDPANSVVDHTQHSWDHDNLYLVGPGSMPSIGTSNISLTMAALAFRSAAHIVKYLRAAKAPAAVRS
ncbi:GMC family oxidoreductase [Streptomyces nogalater]